MTRALVLLQQIKRVLESSCNVRQTIPNDRSAMVSTDHDFSPTDIASFKHSTFTYF